MYSLEEEDSGGGKEQSLTATAEAYIRGYARHPADRAVDDLMPQDARWTRAVKRLYAQLPPADQEIMDSYADEETTIDRRDRRRQTKRLAQKLIILAGYESEYTMIMLPGKEKK